MYEDLRLTIAINTKKGHTTLQYSSLEITLNGTMVVKMNTIIPEALYKYRYTQSTRRICFPVLIKQCSL